VRGCIAPFIGAWLYQIPQIGRHVFAIGAVFAIVAMVGFWSMSRDVPKKPSRPTPKVQELVGSK
jgi:hypothetical protein